MKCRKLLAAVIALFVFASCANAAEEIISFRQNISVLETSDIEVREDILINVENISIKHGIKRNFPIERKDSKGRTRPIGFEVSKVFLDGAPAEYSVDYGGSEAVVRIGSADSFIPRGRHTFTILYRAKGEIGFFDDHDELYWNVTGNGWSFPIRHASCEIQLPGGGIGEGIEKTAWYCGEEGSSDSTGAASTKTGGVETVRPLGQGEGLTVVFGWKKGLVEEPPLPELDDPVAHGIAGIFVFAAILCWLVYAWHRWGKDPQVTVIPLFHAPEGLSPASVAYAYTLDFESNALLSANIIDMAVKGALMIEQTGGERKLIFKTPVSYILHKKSGAGALTPDEEKIYAKLFADADSIVVSNENAEIFEAAENNAKSSCRGQLGKLYGTNKNVFSVAALIYAVGVLLLWFKSGEDFPIDMFACAAGGVISFIVGAAPKTSPAKVNFADFAKRLLIQAVIIAFGGVFVAAAGNNVAPFVIFMLSGVCVSIFRPFMTARNARGADLYAQAAGLRLYMTTAEKERLEMLNPPEETPQLFETLLPYALALGVAKTWANRFSNILEEAKYAPDWYNGGTILWLPHSFARSFDETVRSAATPPSQGSGNFGGSWGSGFGGGFSGGGGGGGGGSGW